MRPYSEGRTYTSGKPMVRSPRVYPAGGRRRVAIYHLRSQVISRGKGRSSVAAAAYRSGTRLTDFRTGLVHDYSRRRDDIETFIEAPDGAPAWIRERQELWNGVEEKERRKDSQLCREFDVALPKELSRDQQADLARSYVREEFVSRGMVADVAIHRGDYENPHFHVMLTMRKVSEGGFGKKEREWNSSQELEQWREAWARHANRQLERAGHDARIDHRSYRERGIDQEPTRHEGPNVRQMEARGLRTQRGELNRAAKRRNEERRGERREAERGGLLSQASKKSQDESIQRLESGRSSLQSPKHAERESRRGSDRGRDDGRGR